MSFLDSLAPASGVAVPQPYQLTHNAGADRGAFAGTQGLGQYNLGGQNMGEFAGLTQQGVNNPFAGGYQQGAGQAGQMGQQAGQQAFGAGGQLMGSSLSMLPDVQALLQMGFDPQGALYARTQQQNADQQAAMAARSGVGGTPYGQGVQNQANQNFNIDWQNNQLQRGIAGAGAAGQLQGQIGQGVQQGAGLQGSGIQEYLMGSQLPYSTFGNINANQLALLNQAGQYGNMASQIPQQQIQDYLAYLNQSNQNAGTANQSGQLALNKANSQFQQYNQIGTEMGQAAGLPIGMGGGGGNSGGSGMPNFSSVFKPGSLSGGLTG